MNQKPKNCLGCNRLQAKIDNLKVQRDTANLEQSLRGTELEAVNRVVSAWKHLLNPDFHEQLRIPLDKYIDRCTTTGGTGGGKYQRDAGKRRAK